MYKPANVHHFVGDGANLALLQQQVMASGHFNPVVDSDGLSRRGLSTSSGFVSFINAGRGAGPL